MKTISVKLFLFIVAIQTIPFFGDAQIIYSKDQIRDHQYKVNSSIKNHTAFIDWDTLYSSGIPYALVKTITKSYSDKDYKVSSLNGDEHIFITTGDISNGYYVRKTGNQAGYWTYGGVQTNNASTTTFGQTTESFYTFYFIDTNQKAEITKDFGTKIPSIIVQYDLLNHDSLIRNNVNTFVFANGTPYSDKKKINGGQQPGLLNQLGLVTPPANTQTANNSEPISFQVLDQKIYRDSKQIAFYKEEKGMENGKTFLKLTFCMPDSTVIAIANSTGPDDHNWSILTRQDNQTHTVTSTATKDAYDIANFLITFKYL